MKRAIFVVATFLMIIAGYSEASAFWGSDSNQSKSGLDVAAGYDVNTVTTISGTVISPPARIDQSEHTQMSIATQQGTVTVLLGPWVYWDKQGFTISRDQEISITGSRAQGKDGSIYLFAQRLDNKTSGTTLPLRSESGTPMWSRGAGASGGSGSGSGVGQNFGRPGGAGSGYRGGMGGGRR